tara:strand:+ start:235 stop:567 length:333 start_codon:yes stop_codon:yes gene_type:complete
LDFNSFSHNIAIVKNSEFGGVNEVNMGYVLRGIDFNGAILSLSEHLGLVHELTLHISCGSEISAGCVSRVVSSFAVILDIEHPPWNPFGWAPLVDIVPLVLEASVSSLAV